MMPAVVLRRECLNRHLATLVVEAGDGTQNAWSGSADRA
jgi:hypothetical protein